MKAIENITAGDTYAENQTWEVTVTIPANMGDGKINLLSFNDGSEPESSDEVTDFSDTEVDTTKPKERKTGWIIAIVAGSVLLAAGAAAGVVFYLKKKKATPTETPAEASAAEPEEKSDE